MQDRKPATRTLSLGDTGTTWPARRMLVSLLASLTVFAVASGEARAQCSVGDYVGLCSVDAGFEGCCNGQRVTWCEGTAQCEINCGDNVNSPTNSCCTESSSAGCCDQAIMECVCALDDFCCGAEDPFFGGAGFWDEFCVDMAMLDCGGCGTCTGPATQCGWNGTEGYYDCSAQASSDPTGMNPRTCGGGCTPNCAGRQCGSDGCGGVCGQCLSSQSCNTSTGQCVASCTPSCSGRQCGPDGCGGVCGQCGLGQTCSGSGQCVSSCTPSCSGRQCGPDGCGGVCGQCLSGQTCNTSTGQCASSCTPQCSGKQCGPDGCGGVCGQCLSAEQCSPAGQCVAPCTPQCAGKQCGDDGCGGVCGQCLAGTSCQAGVCVAGCTPSCSGKVCGDDGCGGSCGTCTEGESCNAAGQCASSCSCEGKQCGDDGCGRTCGFCGPNTVCNAETQQCDARPVTTPDQDPGETINPQACPQGQIWSDYAAACVVDPNAAGASRGDSSGCGGGAMPSLLGLLALFGLLRRRAL